MFRDMAGPKIFAIIILGAGFCGVIIMAAGLMLRTLQQYSYAEPARVESVENESAAEIQPTQIEVIPTLEVEPTKTTQPPAPPFPTETPSSLVPQIDSVSCVPKDTKSEYGEVKNVVDGDTINVQIGDTIFPVRYIGIDTPESGESYGTESKAKNSELVAGKWVLLVKDVSEVDRYDRLLRYVFVGNIFVNHELVNTGFAEAKAYPPDTACHATFQTVEYNAKSTGIGIWKPPPTPYPTPKPTALAKQPTSPPTSNCHPSYPDVCLKMNAGDYDCAGGSGNGPNYVNGPIKVLQPDPFDLDRDGDGWGCE